MLHTYLSLLKPLIAFKSISTDPDFAPDCDACADWLIDLFQSHGFETQKIIGYGNPLVYTYYEANPEFKTYLVYGHYDVQPADQSDGRTSNPFELTQTAERLFARGAVDNKGQHLIHIVSIFELIKEGKLNHNIKFLIEGDEETGSPHLTQCMLDHKDLLTCDTAIISDGEIIGHETPTMTASFRGGANMTITLSTAKTDLHSGIYGNIAPSASHEASILVSKLHTNGNLIAIPGWYDSLDEITEIQIANNNNVPFSKKDIFEITGIKSLLVPDGHDPVTANGLLPTIQVSGISSGYTSNGYKNIIPGSATIKLNFRFGPGQDATKMIELFKEWVKQILSDYIQHTIETSDPYDAITIKIDNEDTAKASMLLGQVYGTQTIMRYCGAAVPIAGLFQDILGCDVVIADLANEDCNMHGVDENFRLSCIQKGLDFSRQFFIS